jgi:hypothetical protein
MPGELADMQSRNTSRAESLIFKRMNENEPANFAHERFNRLDAKLDRILETLGTVVSRLSSLEEQTSLMRRDITRVEHRLDTFDERLRRIENSLN